MNSAEQYYTSRPPRRLTRSPRGVIAGVCAGLSDCYGINLIFVRVVFVVLGLANGIGLILYLVLILVIPARQPAEASATEIPCPPPSPKRTLLAYIAGAVSISAAVLTLVNNISSIVDGVERLLATLRPAGVHAVLDEPIGTPANSPAHVQRAALPYALQGSARVAWRAEGVAYEGEINMAGATGVVTVVYRNPERFVMERVHQNLALRYADQSTYLVGSEPSVYNYAPDIFRLTMDGDGYLKVTAVCDMQTRSCTPADRPEGRLQGTY